MKISKINIKNLKSKKISFECEVVTPMFIGGANKEEAELRSSSIKGLLRFWWRVINGYKFDSIKKMYEKEKEIFGSTVLSSSFQLIVSDISNSPKKDSLPPGDSYTVNSSRGTFNLNIINYLAYGSLMVWNNEMKRNVYIRSYYPVGTIFKIIFDFYNENYKNDVLLAFKILANYGGIGAKSRNGFGCFRIIEGEENLKNLDINVENYDNVAPKEFLIYSKNRFIYNLKNKYNSWDKALSKLGLIYRDSRLGLEGKHTFFKRSNIGKPIVARNENIPDFIKFARLAKPLFLHVNKIDNSNYSGQILVLPYKFKNRDNNIYFDNDFWVKFKNNIDSNLNKYDKI